MKFLKSYWKKFVLILAVLLIVVYSFSFGITFCLNQEIYKQNLDELKIYYVLHIETFEGGSKSRLDFLKIVAKKIEANNPNILFLIKSIKPENLANELTSNVDLISFGFGLGELILPHLVPIEKTFDVQKKLQESGQYAGKIYALPFIMSGYAMITHGAQTIDFVCGENGYIHPQNMYSSLQLFPIKNLSQYEAYKYFVNTKSATLLGTARDVYRVNNLMNIGRLTASISPMGTFTDLIQYIGKTKNDEFIDKFIELLLSTEIQTKLCEFSLFSSLDIKLYSSGIYSQMEEAINQADVPKVFYE